MDRRRIDRIRTWLDGLLDFGTVAWLCIYPLCCASLAFVFFMLVPQGQDLLRILIERRVFGIRGTCALVLYFFAAAGLALGVWYAARVLLTREFAASGTRLNSTSAVMTALRVYFPRALALLVLLPTALISPLTGQSVYFSLAGSIVAVAVMTFIVMRRRLFPAHFKSRPDAATDAADVTSAAATRATLAITTKIAIGVWAAVAVALFVGFALSPVTLPRWFGSATIVLVALLGWTIFGSFALVLLPKSLGLPSLAVLLPLVLVIGSSAFNDNHAPREAKRTVSEADAVRELRRPAGEYFARWLASRHVAEGVRYPVFVVAAEGGGLRAAYWTGAVLGQLQDAWSGSDRFSDHVFAISGVSGGGLGAAVYAGLVAEADRGADLRKARDGCDRTGYAGLARCILNDDFLSPTIAALLFSNMCQQFVPYPIHWADRARALEEAWEVSWKAVTRSEAFAAQFEELWRTPDALAFAANLRVPSLFINGTVVEDGRRIIFSNLAIDGAFVDAYEGVTPIAAIASPDKAPVVASATLPPLPLSTAVHMGARFTYVSPAARLERRDAACDHCLWGRVVDGGYHENSGAETALDILQILHETIETPREGPPLPAELYLILITNDPNERPVVLLHSATLADAAPVKPAGAPLLAELLSPIETLLSVRESRSPYARTIAARLMRRLYPVTPMFPPAPPHVFEFYLDRKTSDPALGWVLSGQADASMDRALLEGHNRDAITSVLGVVPR